MDLIEIEEKAKKILELRYERKKIQEEINVLVSSVTEYMGEKDKFRMKAGRYDLEIVKRFRRDIDFVKIDKLVEQGVVPEEYFRKSSYERLLIGSGDKDGKKLVLEGGRFVYK